MEISQYISELLHNHDCVIIPGFGGFVCNYHPAFIHPVQHAFHPPSKKILFNKELKANDGLLTSHVAINNGISFEAALHQIEQATDDLALRIESGERVSLEKIGQLYLDSDGNILFDQDNTVNYLKNSFGLASFISPPIQRNIHRPVRKTETKYADRTKHPEKRNNLRTAAYWSSGVAATFLLLALVIINLDGFNTFVRNETGFLPTFYQKTEAGVKLSENPDPTRLPVQNIIIPEVQPDPLPSVGDDMISSGGNLADAGAEGSKSPEEKTESKPESKTEIAAVTEEAKPSVSAEKLSARMYHLIAGSFEKAENANTLIADYANDGYDPKIIGQADNGYYRVSIAAFLRKDDALSELEKVRVRYNPNIWLLRQ